jgi:hypothetical protein
MRGIFSIKGEVKSVQPRMRDRKRDVEDGKYEI